LDIKNRTWLELFRGYDHHVVQPDRSRAVEVDPNVQVIKVNSLHVGNILELDNRPTAADTWAIVGLQRTFVRVAE
jgi:hypothetical protein